MFDQLVKSTLTLERYWNGPFAQERKQYLCHLHQRGHGEGVLKATNIFLLAIAAQLDLQDLKPVTIAELTAAAEVWSRRRTRPSTSPKSIRGAKTQFVSIGSDWLRTLGRLQETHQLVPFAAELDAFLRYLREERGFAETTVIYRRRSLRLFFQWLSERHGSIAAVSPREITQYFSLGRPRPWKRATVKFHVHTLRSFFRYAESQKSCSAGIAATIDSPRMYSYERLPQGPTWSDVQRLIASVSGDHPTQIRNRTVILLLALYGFRIGEVCLLTLDDIDWDAERIRLRRPKQRKVQEYPLTLEVGAAILRYLKEVRPRSCCRELFLTLKKPYRPIPMGSLGSRIGTLVRQLGLQLPHHGPHVLRHACATHLLAEGFSLKEIGDHLGHRSAQATQIYAKVDLPSLRQVAELDISDLIQHAEQCQREATPIFPKGSLRALREVARLNLGGVQ